MTIQAQLADGRVLEFPDGTDPQVIQNTVKAQLGQQPQQPQQEVQQNAISIPEQITGAATLASDVVGTSAGGLTALVDVLNPFTDNDPTKLIEDVKAKFKIPPTEGGERALNQISSIIEGSGVGDVLNSISAFSDRAGQQGLDLTGSPAFATFVKMIPDVILEVAGSGLLGKASKAKALAPDVAQAKRAAISSVESTEELTGIKQLTSDVFPPESKIGKLFQSQGELVAGFQRKGQQAERVRAVEKLVNKYDVVEGVGFESKIVNGLKNSIQTSKKAIGELYDKSTKRLDELGSVPLTKTKRFAQDVIDRELKKGTRADQSVIDDMQTLVDAPDDLTFELVKEIRSGVGANLEKVNRGAPVQGNADTGLLKRTYSQLSNDMIDFAKAADPDLAEKWQKANKIMTEFATGTSKRGAKSIIKSGDATPEVVDTLLFSGKNSDVEFLANNLDDAGKVAAKQRILQRVLEKSSIDGDDINPNKFLSQLNKNRNQIGKMFDPEERKAIFALRDQLSKTRRAQDAKVTTPTGQELVLPAALVSGGLTLTPGIVQGIIESKPIRNLIIKRKAAKTAKQRAVITEQIQKEMSKAQLTGALTAGAALTQQEQK
jgi:hypothetical protein